MATVRYLLTTLDPQANAQPVAYPTAELPFTNVSFSLCFNQAGPFSATLNVEDPQVHQANWMNATNPGKTFFWVQVDGQLVYGGRILAHTYNLSANTVTITGSDFYGYWTQRLQAADYTAYVQDYAGASSQTYAWAAKKHGVPAAGSEVAGAPAPMIAWQLLRDAAAVSGSLPNLAVPFHGQGAGAKSDPDYWISNPDGYETNYVTFSAPISQQQTVDSLIQQLVGMGYLIGVDVVTPVSRDTNGNPHAQCWVCWPRYGETAAQQATAGQSLRILDLSTVIDLEWSQDATAQATALVEMTGGGGVKAGAKVIDTVAIGTHHYPLTELAVSHTSTSPSALSSAVLATLVNGDRDLYAYPQIAPVVTLPAFAHGTGWALTELPLGMDVGVFNPYERQGLSGVQSLPFPTWNALAVMRLIRADVQISDSGVSTMQLTLNVPPGDPQPPGYE
jgi:hypothetical protein